VPFLLLVAPEHGILASPMQGGSQAAAAAPATSSN
jgi:hypothetical protein